MREQGQLSLVLVHPSYPQRHHSQEKKVIASILEKSVYRATDLVSILNEDDFLLGLFNLNKSGTDVIVDRIIAQTNELKQQFGIEIWAGGFNLSPNKDIRLETVFDELQLFINSPDIHNEKHFSISEYQHH
ncbi:hypothetical protein C2869_17425 [Saccharobesus litoralis]|uniref:GGDEF domain-containing protein n=2 Tax=Saccharobesus litoralis TaxID=2172099 RepID=A0A2S0VV94_9ALTE|nr:hypothetical protein C2869_17425 [Saccharobesus litoralis]